METRQLRYFVAVAETRHFGRAAEALRIAQSPLSQAIRQLESQLGAPLFERTTRRVDLTAAGEALLPEAVRILASLDAARDQVGRVAAGALGRLRVGATGLATYRHVPELVRRLDRRAARPRADVHHRHAHPGPGDGPGGAPHRPRGPAPAGAPTPASTTTCSPASTWCWPCRRATGSRGARDARLRGSSEAPSLPRRALADLADDDFVVYAPPGSVVGEAAARACRAAGFTPRRTHEADQTSIVLALVAAGVGVALLPSSVLAVAVEGVQLRRARGPRPRDHRRRPRLAARRPAARPRPGPRRPVRHRPPTGDSVRIHAT